MHIQWSAHLKTPEEKQKFEQQVRSAQTVLERLTTIVQGRLINARSNPISDYEKAGWPYLQADKAGAIRELEEMLRFVNLTVDSKPTRM